MEPTLLSHDELINEDPLLHSTSSEAADCEKAEAPRQCRICLEEEDDPEEAASDDPLIAPCRCKGSQEWVHRKCLDDWRATNPNHIAFSKCTECLTEYKLVYTGPSAGRTEYCCYVTRDIGLGCLVLLLCMLSFGWILWLCFSSSSDNNAGFRTFAGVSVSTSNWFQLFLAYTVTGLVVVLVLLGIYGLSMFLAHKCSMSDTIAGLEETADAVAPAPRVHGGGTGAPQSRSMDRSVTQESYRHRHHHRRDSTQNSSMVQDCYCCPHCDGYQIYFCTDACNGCCQDCQGGCCDCDCSCPSGDGGGSNDGLGFAMVAIVVALATVGMVVGVFLSSLLINHILQRHLFRLKKQRLTQNFVVVDLSGRSPPPRTHWGSGEEGSPAVVELPPPVPPPTNTAGKLPPPLAPPRDGMEKGLTSKEEGQYQDDVDELAPHRDYLKKLGLL
ncbi:protein ligase MARCH5 [Seminavis robusta]|uniref:Protein ligase MARCH5 n=1 Tax=Seminavis robusta TaxID=568900 RepID=A0A9N8DUM7_9STRA|nr:protein ligase MARCH5 [Seminavis robusta]|eukprot:Sro364_g127030.1 protein ligase MARCH5 (442) ;mRNA; r:15154-16479